MLHEVYRNQFKGPMAQETSRPISQAEKGNFARPVLTATLISALIWGLIIVSVILLK